MVLYKFVLLLLFLLLLFLMSSFLEIDFVIKIHAKKSRRFDLSINILQTVKNR